MQITSQWIIGDVSRVQRDQGGYIERAQYCTDELATLIRTEAAGWSEQLDKA